MADPPVDEVIIVGPRESGTWKAVVNLLRQGHYVRLVHPLRTTSRRDVERGIGLVAAYLRRSDAIQIIEPPRNTMSKIVAVIARADPSEAAGARVPRRPRPSTPAGAVALPIPKAEG